MNKKARLRRAGRAARLALSDEERESFSLTIAEHVAGTPHWHRAKYIASYLPMADEVDTWPVVEKAWRMGKRIFAPVTGKNSRMRFAELSDTTRLARNAFGLAEPVGGVELEPDRFDIVIAPLLAFDDQGNRIGMGGGYYDRAFAFLRHRSRYRRPKLIGVAFAVQQAESVPASPWDIPLFQVYTEHGPAVKSGDAAVS